MANTNDLKNVIEPALLERFWLTSGVEPIVPTLGLRRELFGMEFDGIGIHRKKRALLFCETTLSGYLGHRGRDTQAGAVKKFADSFARFSIVVHQPVRHALLAAVTREYGIEFKEIKCHLVVPKGSRFIRALGYRTQLLQMDAMALVEIELPASGCKILEAVSNSARAEMS
jgi:hypothetical protein